MTRHDLWNLAYWKLSYGLREIYARRDDHPHGLRRSRQPADPTQAFTATYDAWNRLVKIEDGSGTVAQYEYDGAKRRTVKESYASGTLSETRHFYYTEPSRWQVVEERVESSSDAERQFVWGLHYVDDIVIRDRDTDDNGTLDERLYGLQDANWNTIANANPAGSLTARFIYSPFGEAAPFTGAFIPKALSIDVLAMFAGLCCDLGVSLYLARHRYFHGNRSRGGEKRRGDLAFEVCRDRIDEIGEDRTLLEATGFARSEHALDKSTA